MNIYIATHKDYVFPKELSYVPIQVGRALNSPIEHIIGDDSGINISSKNRSYCELTALYWLWKNCNSDICGLVHYRRYFSSLDKDGAELKGNGILSPSSVDRLLSNYDIIVPEKSNLGHDTVFSLFLKYHYVKDLVLVHDVIAELWPEHVPAFDSMMGETSLSLFNMFISKKQVINEYCEWLFPILETLEGRVDISRYSNYQKRLFGFLSERLFNVWLYHNRFRYKVTYVPVVSLEPITHSPISKLDKIILKVENYNFFIKRYLWSRIYSTLFR